MIKNNMLKFSKGFTKNNQQMVKIFDYEIEDYREVSLEEIAELYDKQHNLGVFKNRAKAELLSAIYNFECTKGKGE